MKRFCLLFCLVCFAIPVLAQDTTAPRETMPEFPGGMSAFQKYLSDSIRYPKTALDAGHSGTVYVYFEVAKDSSIEKVKVTCGVPGAPELDDEAARVIAGMPKWNPGTLDGKVVRVGMTVPVRFVLNDDKPSKKKRK